jgi:thiamine biosynthesis protein ThiC
MWKHDVQVMIEGLRHVPLQMVRKTSKSSSKPPFEAPFSPWAR